AKNHADRAESATDVSGLRDEVTQQIAAVVDGSPAALDTIREVAEYAQANRGITDQLNAAIGDKANKSHTHTTSQVTGLDDALSGKAAKTHTHTTSQVKGLDTALNGKADKTHTHSREDIGATASIEGSAVVSRWSDGKISVPSTPEKNTDATSKFYVDAEVAKKADKSHTHAQSDITGLSTALNNTAAKTHKHTTADITDFATEMGKKANTSHTHKTSQISGLSTALSKKADKTYVESRPAIFTVPDINTASTENLVQGDVIVDTSTWIFYYLK